MPKLKAAAALSCAILFSVIGGQAANAATIQAFDSGWYQNNGLTAGVSNINVGSSNLFGQIYNNYLAFNLAGLADQNITSATLTFYGRNGVNTLPPAKPWGYSIIRAASLPSSAINSVSPFLPIWVTAIATVRQSSLPGPSRSSR
jgi:hypothetical protein